VGTFASGRRAISSNKKAVARPSLRREGVTSVLVARKHPVGGNTAEVQLAGRVGSRECVRERRAKRRIPVALKREDSAGDGIQRFGRIVS
jgi:hypothetical protein